MGVIYKQSLYIDINIDIDIYIYLSLCTNKYPIYTYIQFLFVCLYE
jgi:hypothetical protein